MAFAAVSVTMAFAGCTAQDDRVEPDYSRLSSEAYASRVPYPNLVIEVDYAQGWQPDPWALESLRSTIRNVTDKDDVVILSPTPLPSERRFQDAEKDWEGEEIALHEEFFDSGSPSSVVYGHGDTAYLHLMYLNGVYKGEGQGAMGLATARTIFIFPEYFRERPGVAVGAAREIIPDDTEARIERSVLIHEMGHQMGLVNNGAPMVRPHDDGGSHSANPRSVMHRGIEETPLPRSPALENDYPYEFDEDDLADLRALQRGAGRS